MNVAELHKAPARHAAAHGLADRAGLASANIDKALAFSVGRLRDRKIINIADEFSDPSRIAEALIKYGKVDETNLIASILYPSLRPVAGKELDEAGLLQVEEKFGKEVAGLVRRTLKLRALEFLPHLKSEEDRKTKPSYRPESERIKRFRLMALWVAEDPRAILIRSIQFLARLEDVNPDTDRLKGATVIRQIHDIYAPLADLCGYRDLRNQLLNQSLRMEDPELFEDIAKKSRRLNENKKLLEGIQARVVELMGKKLNLTEGTHYEIEVRVKEPHSIWASLKAGKNLLDLLGVRVIFKDSATEALTNNLNRRNKGRELTWGQRQSTAAHKIYETLAREWGRRNPKLKGRLAQNYPTRFKDYFKKPKLNGYHNAIHDVALAEIGGHLREIEFQIVAAAAHQKNQYGIKAGHEFFKAGFNSRKASIVRAWREYAHAIVNGEEPPQKWVFVYTNYHDIIGHKGPVNIAEMAIHIAVGLAARALEGVIRPLFGAKQTVPLSHHLQSGDVLDVKTVEGEINPEILSYLPKASDRASIRKWVNGQMMKRVLARLTQN